MGHCRFSINDCIYFRFRPEVQPYNVWGLSHLQSDSGEHGSLGQCSDTSDVYGLLSAGRSRQLGQSSIIGTLLWVEFCDQSQLLVLYNCLIRKCRGVAYPNLS